MSSSPCSYPCFENPYPMDLHESPVTACLYAADCAPDLIPAFFTVGSKQKKTGFSEKVSFTHSSLHVLLKHFNTKHTPALLISPHCPVFLFLMINPSCLRLVPFFILSLSLCRNGPSKAASGARRPAATRKS